jgi:hypothetical protein
VYTFTSSVIVKSFESYLLQLPKVKEKEEAGGKIRGMAKVYWIKEGWS